MRESGPVAAHHYMSVKSSHTILNDSRKGVSICKEYHVRYKSGSKYMSENEKEGDSPASTITHVLYTVL